MNLHPARKEGESFKDYKVRRALENAAVWAALNDWKFASSLTSRNDQRVNKDKALRRRIIKQFGRRQGLKIIRMRATVRRRDEPAATLS